MTVFTARVIQIIQQIPAGKVMTYGQVAKAAGSPRGARQVVRILHSMSRNYELPWHRIINSKGEIALKSDDGAYRQKELLRLEGVVLDQQERVNLDDYGYIPNIDWEPEDV